MQGINYFDYAIETAECGAAGAGGSVALTGSVDAERVYNFLVAKGLKPFQAAGVMGNMQAESGIEPQRLQGTRPGVKTVAAGQPGAWRFVQEDTGKVTPSSTGGGWGIVQWTPASKYVSTQNPISQANDLGTQLEFLWGQLEGRPPLSEKRAGDDLKATTSIEQAVLAFQGGPAQNIGGQTVGPYTGYERPANKTASIPARYSAAKGFLALYGSGAPSVSPVGAVDAAAPVPTGCAAAGGGAGGGPADMATIFQASDSVACSVGTDGGVQDGYRKGVLVKVRICNVPTGVANGTVAVNSRIAQTIANIYSAAKAQGVVMSGGGFRTMAQQTSLNAQKPAMTAKPGFSNHQMGLAVDFTINGSTLKEGDAGFNWMTANKATHGLEWLRSPYEPWHWSVNGE